MAFGATTFSGLSTAVSDIGAGISAEGAATSDMFAAEAEQYKIEARLPDHSSVTPDDRAWLCALFLRAPNGHEWYSSAGLGVQGIEVCGVAACVESENAALIDALKTMPLVESKNREAA